jgi:hypothetical protein
VAAESKQTTMNFVLTHKWADGNTPIRQEDAEQNSSIPPEFIHQLGRSRWMTKPKGRGENARAWSVLFLVLSGLTAFSVLLYVRRGHRINFDSGQRDGNLRGDLSMN